jgi:D-tagatose-1,6-bisphosphate aldolase subunit GatZ/KbaZ
MDVARERNQALLVEATANQVNQSGGYTGFKPAAFVDLIAELARDAQLPIEKILIGADHLGPHVWRQESAAIAMERAEDLIVECIGAGFRKIHLDTAVACADDDPPLSVEIAARRAARLCRAAEAAAQKQPYRPLYVIGTEVPVPGGGLNAERSEVKVTDPTELSLMLDCFADAFGAAGLAEAWRRIVAVVVQPGVDFGDRQVAVYRTHEAAELSAAHAKLDGSMVYEVHATDYQPADAIAQMIRDHFTLLKVGPSLTFAMRESLYKLGEIESRLPEIDRPARLSEVLERTMLQKPEFWQAHYHGSEGELFFLRHNSLRDRIRYYWHEPAVKEAVAQLIRNLRRPIPLTLLRRFLPEISDQVECDLLPAEPRAVVKAYIRRALEPYVRVCGP